MFWLNPAALFALAAVALPILIHLLVQRRAERLAFPTLRFLQPTRLAAIRRHLLEDPLLLAVRVALLAAAVAAVAGPLFVTAARRQVWDRRVVRATVVDTTITGESRAENPAPHQEKTFQGASIADGLRRAVLWLDAAPPARREIVVASSFPIGSLAGADIAEIPPDIGVRFERAGTLPVTRTASAGAVLTSEGTYARDVTFTAGDTSVRESSAGGQAAFPIEIAASAAERPAIDAAVTAVLSQRVWAAPPDRRARLVVLSSVAQGFPPPLADKPGEPRRDAPKPVGEGGSPASMIGVSAVTLIQLPWMAEAVAQIARDPDLRATGARVATGLSDARFTAAPWQILTSAGDSRPLAVAAGSAKSLVVVTAAPASAVAMTVLLRSIANALAPPLDLQAAEVVPIDDTVLRGWSRLPMPVTSPRVESVDDDDRRWLWLAVLCLMAVEMWIRRARPAEVALDRHEEDARVA